jgi:hypothetical protein
MGRQHGGESTGNENGSNEAVGTGGNSMDMGMGALKDMMKSMKGGGKRGRRGRKSSRRGRKSSRRGHSSKKGGQGVVETAAVPFGLLALQRYFKGSKTSKQGVNSIGNSFKRTLRFKRKSRKHRKH